MTHKQNRRQTQTHDASNATQPTPGCTQVMPDLNRVMNLDVSVPAAWDDGEPPSPRNDPENSEILLAACRIVISGYRTETSRGQRDSVFVQAAYQLLHNFLERQFERNSRAA
jgi:hypothetical protein